MVESILIECNNDDNISEFEISKALGVDLFSKLENELSNDILFKTLKESNSMNELINDSMTELLKEDTLYSTTAVSKMLSIPNSTLRGWIAELDDYINPKSVGDVYKLNYKSIFKLRMVQILRQNNKYAIGYIKSITLGTEILEDENKQEKSLNEKVEELIEENENMKLIIKKMAEGLDMTQNIVLQLIDNETFNTTGKVLLNSDKLNFLLESKENNTQIDEKIDKTINEAKIEIDESVSKKIEEALKELNEKISDELSFRNDIEVNSKNIVISTDEIKSYSRKLKHKSLWEKIFGIKSKK